MAIKKRLTKRWQDTPCIPWEGAIDANGYGRLGSRLAYRMLWENERWPIPKGMELDHLCRRRDCVNLLHLEVVTKWENINRSGAWKWRTMIDKCPKGHPYDEENTGYIQHHANGKTRKHDSVGRFCKECKRQQWRDKHAATKAARCEEKGHQRIEKVAADGRVICAVCASEQARKARRAQS